MKTRKLFSLAIATAMALTSMSAFSANAAELKGDLDGDGYVTGHDTAMLSRAFYVDATSLTQEQLDLADMDGNGKVDFDDLTALHNAEEIWLTDLRREYEYRRIDAAYYALMISSYEMLNYNIELVPEESFLETNDTSTTKDNNYVYRVDDHTVYVSELKYNLMDVDGNGKLEIVDAMVSLRMCSIAAISSRITDTKEETKNGIYSESWPKNRYDLGSDYISGTFARGTSYTYTDPSDGSKHEIYQEDDALQHIITYKDGTVEVRDSL